MRLDFDDPIGFALPNDPPLRPGEDEDGDGLPASVRAAWCEEDAGCAHRKASMDVALPRREG